MRDGTIFSKNFFVLSSIPFNINIKLKVHIRTRAPLNNGDECDESAANKIQRLKMTDQQVK